MKELGIDTVYEKLKDGVEGLPERLMNETDWSDQVGILLTGNEAKLLIHYIEMSIEFINEVKAAAGMKQNPT